MPSVRNGFETLGGVTSLAVDGPLAIRKGFPFTEFIQQCWFISKVTVVPLVFISIPFGVILALHVGSFFTQIGAESHIGATMIVGIVRESAPVATGRSGVFDQALHEPGYTVTSRPTRAPASANCAAVIPEPQ